MDDAIDGFDLQVRSVATGVSDTILGAMGDIFLPFVSPAEAFEPNGVVEEKEKSVDKSKMKPKELRNAQEFRNAALREAAMLGTLHLPVAYAGKFKTICDKLRRSRDRMQRHRTFLEFKVQGKYKNFTSTEDEEEVPGEEKKPGGKGIIEMRMREMHEKKMEIMTKSGPAKVQKALQAAWDYKKGVWKRADLCKGLADKQKVIAAFWQILWLQKEGFVRSKKETDDLEKELKQVKEDNPGQHKTLLTVLKEEGCDVNAARDDDESNFTALMCAARNGNLETVEALLEMPDIDVNKLNSYGANAMHYAAMYAHKEVCQALRRGKVDRKVKNHAGKIPKDLAMDEHNDLLNHKKEQWGLFVYKEQMFKVVEEFGKKDEPDDKLPVPIYNQVFGIHDPAAIEPAKEWKASREGWRISLIPDPACKLDDFEEKDFMKRWKSTAKKLP